MAELELTQGKVAIVDPEDYPAPSGLAWHANLIHGVWYAQHRTKGKHIVGLHTFLTGYREVDHLDGDGLNNRQSNLREAEGQNSANTHSHWDGTSVFKGVSWHESRHKWTAQLTVRGVKQHLGYFAVETDAARAYDAAARQVHGTYGRYNFPQPGEQSALR